MTEFYRSPHTRRGPFGQSVSVKGHSVCRDNFDRTSHKKTSGSTHSYLNLKSKFDRLASRTLPNYTCPKCGKKIFFYKNESGSKVFFDHLGPPWPKHPCLSEDPPRRNLKDDAQIELQFIELMLIDLRKIEEGHLMVAATIGEKLDEYSYFHLPDICEEIGNVERFFFDNEEISFFDQESLNLGKLKAFKLNDAKSYVQLLVGIPDKGGQTTDSSPFDSPSNSIGSAQMKLSFNK